MFAACLFVPPSAAAVRRVAAPYNRSITALRRLYAGKIPHFNIPQERRAPAE